MSTTTGTVVLICKKTNWRAELPISAVSLSRFICASLQRDPSSTEFVLDFEQHVLILIVEYLTMHDGNQPSIIEPPLRSRRMIELCMNPQDAAFIDKIASTSQDLLYDISLAALYLHIEALTHLACAKIATIIKARPLDQMRELLMLESDRLSNQDIELTQQQQQQQQQQHSQQ